jgi:hypothetical protein
VNDAFRGAISVVALVALYYAVRVGFTFLNSWTAQKNRDLRRHLASHAFWMPVSLGTSALLAVLTEMGRVGENTAVDERSWLRLFIVVAAYLGLRPLREHNRKSAKVDDTGSKVETTTDKTGAKT